MCCIASARPSHTIPRLFVALSGVEGVELSVDSPLHPLLDRYWEAVAWYFATGDSRPVRSFAAFRVRGVALVTAPGELDAWPQTVRRVGGRRR